jgi:hypothetical protein
VLDASEIQEHPTSSKHPTRLILVRNPRQARVYETGPFALPIIDQLNQEGHTQRQVVLRIRGRIGYVAMHGEM